MRSLSTTMKRLALLLALMTTTLLATLAVYITLASQASASDSVSVDTSVGTAAPPATLGGYTMSSFAPDSRPESLLFCDFFACSWEGFVTDVPAPGGGTLRFDQTMVHAKVGSSSNWGNWSHGYTGDVYSGWFGSSPDQLVMTLPANTQAFYFYAEPNQYEDPGQPSLYYDVAATTDDGTTSGPIAVNGNAGAKYFGFYSKDGSALSTIRVNVDPGALGFAVGEFGINDDDHQPPNTFINAGPSGPTNDNTPTFTFSGTDNTTPAASLDFSYRVDGGSWTAFSSAESVTLPAMPDGAHTFHVRARDQAGIIDPSKAQRSFTVDTKAPRVTDIQPADGAPEVSRRTNVVATLSERMQAATVKSSFKLYKKGSTTPISATFNYDARAMQATLNPFGSTENLLARGTTYKAVVSTDAKDLAGNRLDQKGSLSGLQPKVWYFTTKR